MGGGRGDIMMVKIILTIYLNLLSQVNQVTRLLELISTVVTDHQSGMGLMVVIA